MHLVLHPSFPLLALSLPLISFAPRSYRCCRLHRLRTLLRFFGTRTAALLEPGHGILPPRTGARQTSLARPPRHGLRIMGPWTQVLAAIRVLEGADSAAPTVKSRSAGPSISIR